MANEFARALRRSRTVAERKLWTRLRLLKARGWKFRQQVPIGRFVVDCACLSHRLVIEVDGATHSSTSELAHDAAREAVIRAQGFRILRFWNSEMATNLDAIMDQIVWTLEDIDRSETLALKHIVALYARSTQ
jgi:very-short-patch-repair endonuclease